MAVGGMAPHQNSDYDFYNGSFAMTPQQVIKTIICDSLLFFTSRLKFL